MLQKKIERQVFDTSQLWRSVTPTCAIENLVLTSEIVDHVHNLILFDEWISAQKTAVAIDIWGTL